MTIVALLTLFAIARAVYGHPINADAFYDIKDGSLPIVVSRLLVIVLCHIRSLFDLCDPESHPNYENTFN